MITLVSIMYSYLITNPLSVSVIPLGHMTNGSWLLLLETPPKEELPYISMTTKEELKIKLSTLPLMFTPP